MGLSPNIHFPTILDTQPQPSKTYKLDIETGEIGEKLDGRKAIEQFITKAIHTIRHHFSIYSDDYGCEIKNLFGKGFSDRFIKTEIVRMVTEAIIYDDRIDRVYDFEIVPDNDEVYISFSVDTVEGIIPYKGVM
ncbi:DUF2634 domain-containing protein [Brevibacillus sp. SYSU BS000544]|uniref:DUF2634 domain-containing protein n=1 Tax=Brevibacillus sp. SYSU BS000544 TaxID=3416443 RepID=UPI003CE494F1